MRKFSVFFLLLFACFLSQAQTWQWLNQVKTSPGYKKMARDDQGNVFAAVPFSGTLTIGGSTFTSVGYSNYVLVKYNVYGSVIWAKHLAMTASGHKLEITDLDIAGNDVLLVGNYEGQSGFNPSPTVTGYGSFVAGFELSSGTLSYIKEQVRSSSDKGFLSACYNPNNQAIYIAGSIKGSDPQYTFYAVKYIPGGSFDWYSPATLDPRISFHAGSIERVGSLIIVGGMYECGAEILPGPVVTFNCRTIYKLPFAAGIIYGGFLAKISESPSSGCNWLELTKVEIEDIAALPDGSFIGVGDNIAFSSSIAYIAKVDPTVGTKLWEKELTSADENINIQSLAVAPGTGDIYVAGKFWGAASIKEGANVLLQNSTLNSSSSNMFVLKYASAGSFIKGYQADMSASSSDTHVSVNDVLATDEEWYLSGSVINGTAKLDGFTLGTGGAASFLGVYAPAPYTIKVTSPNGGNQLVGGHTHPITWTGGSKYSTVTIEYSLNNGTSWTPIASGVKADSRSYNWVVPKVNSTTARVRVQDADPNVADQSDNVFTIVEQTIVPTLTVTSPNGGEVLTGGNYHNITWSANYNASTVKLYYSANGGASWTLITQGVNVSAGSYWWEVPATVNSTACRVKVEDSQNASVNDISNNNFTVKPRFRVVEPTSSSLWGDRALISITWEDYVTATYNIDYHNGSGVWTRLRSGVSGTSVTMNAPNQPCDYNSSQAMVRVTRISNGESATSSPFSVADGPDPDCDFYDLRATTAVVYPNPVSAKGAARLTVNHSALKEGEQVTVRLYGLSAPAQMLREQTVVVQNGKLVVNASGLKEGLYTLVVVTPATTFSEKFSVK